MAISLPDKKTFQKLQHFPNCQQCFLMFQGNMHTVGALKDKWRKSAQSKVILLTAAYPVVQRYSNWNVINSLQYYLDMKIKQTVFCEACSNYLENMTKKMYYYHQLYHKMHIFSCDICRLYFDTESLLNFHIVKNHQHVIENMHFKIQYNK